MAKTIEITVRDKVASTEFCEVVSFNGVYRLHFDFDAEWDGYENRVAVAAWEGGAAEKLFTGSDCEMPMVCSAHTPYVFLGVYSGSDSGRIASTFVKLRCRAGTFGAPQQKPLESLHEQVLDLLNRYEAKDGVLSVGSKKYDGTDDVTVSAEDLGLPRAAISGSYNDLKDKPDIREAPVQSVNGKTGAVIISKYDLGLPKVALSGDFSDLEGAPDPDTLVTSVNGKTGNVMISKYDLGLPDAAISGSYNDLTDKPEISEAPVKSVNGKTGTVMITKYDLSLPEVALTGSYNDLTDKPDLSGGGSSPVQSVNGKTGAVMITKYDLGLPKVAITGSYNDLTDRPDAASISLNAANALSLNGLGLATSEKPMPVSAVLDGADLNELCKMGFYSLRESENKPISNAPLQDLKELCLMVLSPSDSAAVQVAFSLCAACSVFIRFGAGEGNWTDWKKMF